VSEYFIVVLPVSYFPVFLRENCASDCGGNVEVLRNTVQVIKIYQVFLLNSFLNMITVVLYATIAFTNISMFLCKNYTSGC
jgi:hypothetical protein